MVNSRWCKAAEKTAKAASGIGYTAATFTLLAFSSTPSYAIPSPDLVVGSISSISQLIALASAMIGGGAVVVGVRAGATHESFDVEDDALTDGTLEIIGADRGGNDEVMHEHTVEFAFLVASPNKTARQQPPIDFRRGVRLPSLARD